MRFLLTSPLNIYFLLLPSLGQTAFLARAWKRLGFDALQNIVRAYQVQVPYLQKLHAAMEEDDEEFFRVSAAPSLSSLFPSSSSSLLRFASPVKTSPSFDLALPGEDALFPFLGLFVKEPGAHVLRRLLVYPGVSLSLDRFKLLLTNACSTGDRSTIALCRQLEPRQFQLIVVPLALSLCRFSLAVSLYKEGNLLDDARLGDPQLYHAGIHLLFEEGSLPELSFFGEKEPGPT